MDHPGFIFGQQGVTTAYSSFCSKHTTTNPVSLLLLRLWRTNTFAQNVYIKVESKKTTVLIVDDSFMIVKRLAEMLKELHNVDEIHCAYSFADAISILNVHQPDFISLDINLPDASGIDLLKIVKKDYPGIVVAMLTNQANLYYRDLCNKLGADHFFDKSNDFDCIFDIIAPAN